MELGAKVAEEVAWVVEEEVAEQKAEEEENCHFHPPNALCRRNEGYQTHWTYA